MEFWGQVSGQLVIFEGNLAKMLRFWSSKIHFWRKSRTKASFLSFKASFLKEVSQNCFVFDLQSFNVERSLAQKLRFWASKLHFLKEVSQKSFVFEFQSFNFEGSLAEKLRLTKSFESHISWQPNHLTLKSFDIQITWISNQLTTNSFESQIDWQPDHLNLKSIDNQIIEPQIIWHPYHLNLKSIDNQLIWISNRLTTKSLESQINWQPKSFESQIRWQPNHLTLNSFESHINWLSNQLNSARSLPIGSLSLETSATALCGRYVIQWMIFIDIQFAQCSDQDFQIGANGCSSVLMLPWQNLVARSPWASTWSMERIGGQAGKMGH